MEQVEPTVVSWPYDLEPLHCGLLAQDPTACTWAITAVATAGATFGAGVGRANCHHHGCVHDSDTTETLTQMAGMSVGDLLNVRNDAAKGKR